MPRISELNGTGFPTLGHEFPTEYAGESVKLTIAQVRALMEFLATEIGYNAGTVAEALDDLASGKVDISEYTAALAEKLDKAGDTMTGELAFNKSLGTSNRLIDLMQGYGIFSDNTGIGTANNRLWLNGPEAGEVVVGPRAGAEKLAKMTLRSSSLVRNAGAGDQKILDAADIGALVQAYSAKLAGIVANTRPRFSAAKSVQQAGISNATVTFPTEVFDIGGYYDTATSRWTPPAGTYKIGARVLLSGSIAAGTSYTLSIYKNGGASIFARNQIRAASTGGFSILVEDLVESNGTDTWEINLQSGGASINVEPAYAVSAFYGYEV